MKNKSQFSSTEPEEEQAEDTEQTELWGNESREATRRSAPEALYLVTTGAATIGQFTLDFFVPTLIGNIIGGVTLVAVINHAQVVAGEGIEG